MPLDFPSGPAINDTWTGANGVTYVWNGTAWTVSGSSVGPYLLLAGGTMTGPIALAADPTTGPQAASKHYVDASINLAGNYLGTWAVASNTPNISAGGSISNANYVATTVNPATPETVPVGVPGIAGMSVGNGDRIIWAAGLGVWQILRNAGVTLAAADARYYPLATNPSGYQTAAQVTTALAPYATTAAVNTAVAPYANNVGRNLLHNALFNVQQRGAGPFTSNGAYTMDRWRLVVVSDVSNVQAYRTADADRTGIGDESALWLVECVFAGNAAAGAMTLFRQYIEGVRRLSGKTVTVSFYAKAASGVPKLGISIDQVFGSGGSPSATVSNSGVAVTISTTWARYSVTLNVPSAAGKTVGTNGDDAVVLNIWFSSGSTSNAFTGGIGVQSGTVDIWGVQLEVGSVATPLEKPDPQQDLAKCQRFYQAGIGAHMIGVSLGAAQYFGTGVSLPVRMRAAPTVAWQSNYAAPTNCSQPTADTIDPGGFRALTQSIAGGNAITAFDVFFTASADL